MIICFYIYGCMHAHAQECVNMHVLMNKVCEHAHSVQNYAYARLIDTPCDGLLYGKGNC